MKQISQIHTGGRGLWLVPSPAPYLQQDYLPPALDQFTSVPGKIVEQILL